MRYVVYGAGAVGGTIGGRLHEAGHSVVLIARGPHLETMRERGLTIQSPEGTVARAAIDLSLGGVLVQIGQTDEAKRVWREGRGRDAGNDVLRETLARLRVDL